MKNRSIYLDYNSTSPLDKSVKTFLQEGKFLFANPSSSHSLGQESRRSISASINDILKVFNLDPKLFNLYFHSGASESITTFFNCAQKDDIAIGFNSDHNCVIENINQLKRKNIQTHLLDPEPSGEFPLNKVLEIINNAAASIYINFTHVNNESGVVWPLSLIDSLKKKNVYIHVDNVQSVGKIENWNKLNPSADFYSYSSHKFGSLKGFGFSFVKKDFKFNPLILGGSQQDYRSGTMSELNIKCTSLALNSKIENSSFSDIKKLRDKLEKMLLEDSNIFIIGDDLNRSNNTIQFVHKKHRADSMLLHFDIKGLCVSSGSACNSGSLKNSRYLISLGLDDYSTNSIRISLGEENLNQEKLIMDSLSQILEKL